MFKFKRFFTHKNPESSTGYKPGYHIAKLFWVGIFAVVSCSLSLRYFDELPLIASVGVPAALVLVVWHEMGNFVLARTGVYASWAPMALLARLVGDDDGDGQA